MEMEPTVFKICCLMISYYFGDYQLYTNNLDIYGKIEDIK